MAWQWNTESRRYHDTATGRFLSPQQQLGLRDTFTDALKGRSASLAERLSAGTMTPGEWEHGMRTLVKQAHIDLAVLGRGGRSQMTPTDWGRVGREIRDQYGYLGRFADATPELSEAQSAARSGMYVEAATQSYERANAAAQGVPELPAYPGDGESCLGGVMCRCAWDIQETEDGWECTWVANDDPATCELCIEHAAEWSPLVVAREEAAVAA